MFTEYTEQSQQQQKDSHQNTLSRNFGNLEIKVSRRDTKKSHTKTGSHNRIEPNSNTEV